MWITFWGVVFMSSGTEKNTGTLYLVGTPIGNLDDMSFRAVKILKHVNLVLCEDTRHSLKLFSHYGIETHRASYHDFNKEKVSQKYIIRLKNGEDIALISDAGMPGISDPAFYLVRECAREGLNVTVIPGASAVLSALVVSGLPTDAFVFHGFLPKKSAKRKRHLKELSCESSTLVLYLSKYRLVKELSDIAQVFGNRNAVLCRELTKLNEEILRGTLTEILEAVQSVEPRGEYVLVIVGGSL